METNRNILRVGVISDLHLDHYGAMKPYPIDPSTFTGDVLVIAGDVIGDWYSPKVTEFLTKCANAATTIIILGNHDFYTLSMNTAYDEITTIIGEINKKSQYTVNLLENEVMIIEHVRFIGATFWTNFNNNHPVDVHLARNCMNDYRCIVCNNALINPALIFATNMESREYIKNTLIETDEYTDVVITHHLPHYDCIASHFANSPLNGAFANTLMDDFFYSDNPPEYWIHGHTHDQVDIMVNNTNVVCNPIGYPIEQQRLNSDIVTLVV